MRALQLLGAMTVLGLTGCVTTGPEVETSARSDAALLARGDVRLVAQSWAQAVRSAQTAGKGADSVRASGRRAAAAAPVAYLTLLENPSSADGSPGVEQSLAVVRQVTGGGGGVTSTQTVRVCARVVLLPGQEQGLIANLGCPSSLPSTIPGLGTVTATEPYEG